MPALRRRRRSDAAAYDQQAVANDGEILPASRVRHDYLIMTRRPVAHQRFTIRPVVMPRSLCCRVTPVTTPKIIAALLAPLAL